MNNPIQVFVAAFMDTHKVASVFILIGSVIFFLLLENWKEWFPRGKNNGNYIRNFYRILHCLYWQ